MNKPSPTSLKWAAESARSYLAIGRQQYAAFDSKFDYAYRSNNGELMMAALWAHAFPSAVLLAFAAETQLKMLHFRKWGNYGPGIHDLSGLFSKIDASAKERIRNSYRSLASKPTREGVRLVSQPKGFPPPDSQNPWTKIKPLEIHEADEAVRRASNTFKRFRYLFEIVRDDVPFDVEFDYRWLLCLTAALQKEVDEEDRDNQHPQVVSPQAFQSRPGYWFRMQLTVAYQGEQVFPPLQVQGAATK